MKEETPKTIITLTLPTPTDGGIAPDDAVATLLIQRGDLAHVRQFYYADYLPDLMDAIREAYQALGAVLDHPPIVPATPTTTPPEPEEETIDIPLKKGARRVKTRYLVIIGGARDAAAYREAVAIAGKLIDGKLWDGESPLHLDDVYSVARRIGHLTIKELSLFTLSDFVTSPSET